MNIARDSGSRCILRKPEECSATMQSHSRLGLMATFGRCATSAMQQQSGQQKCSRVALRFVMSRKSYTSASLGLANSGRSGARERAMFSDSGQNGGQKLVHSSDGQWTRLSEDESPRFQPIRNGN